MRKSPHPLGDRPPVLLISLFKNWQKLLWQVVGGLFTVLGQTEPQVDLQLCKDLTCRSSWRLEKQTNQLVSNIHY